MRRFKDLDANQKKIVVNHLFKSGMNSIRWNGAGSPENVQKRMEEIRTQIKFCGCTDCDLKLWEAVNKDSLIKEVYLEIAMKAAESAYYPDDNDVIIANSGVLKVNGV